MKLPASYGDWVASRREKTQPLWKRLAREMNTVASLVVIALVLGVWSWHQSKRIQIGDTRSDVPELRQDSRYNEDSRVITSSFSIGVDILSVIVETIPNGCVDYDVVWLMDRFESHIRAVPGVQSVVSLASAAKTINWGVSEGSLKWRILPRNPQALA